MYQEGGCCWLCLGVAFLHIMHTVYIILLTSRSSTRVYAYDVLAYFNIFTRVLVVVSSIRLGYP